MPPRVQTRRYDRAFDWVYGRLPEAPRESRLIPVTWAGLPLNTGDQASGLCSVVTDVEGWLDSPPLEGNDATRSIADGAAWGPKTLGPRTITIHGSAAGPRAELGRLRDQLTARAASREPLELAITDGGLERTLTADVRAGSERFRAIWHGPQFYTWQVALTAADPILYDGTWQQVTLTTATGEDTGRPYPREFPWRYQVSHLPNAARLANAGNWPAPVFALYEGELSESRLTADLGGSGGVIRVAPIAPGMRIRVATATLTAEAEGGLSRAAFILPGSRPLTVPAAATDRWHLYGTGAGSITLAWRSAWI